MDGIYDLVAMLKDSKIDGVDLLESLKALSRITTYEWQDVIEKEAEKIGVCPECFEPLERQSFVEWYPFGDTMAGQEFVELVCPYHGVV